MDLDQTQFRNIPNIPETLVLPAVVPGSTHGVTGPTC